MLKIHWARKGICEPSLGFACGDVNGNGEKEIITDDGTGELIILKNDGSLYSRKRVSDKRLIDIKILDINDDGFKEVVALSEACELLVISADQMYRIPLPSPPVCSLIADVDNDGIEELLILDVTPGVQIVKKNYKTDRLPLMASLKYIGVHDIDGDGENEIISVYGREIVAFRYEIDKGYKLDYSLRLPFIPYKIIIHDFNNDGKAEIIASHGSHIYLIEDISSPEYKRVASFGGLIKDIKIADIDGNGFREVVYLISFSRIGGKSAIIIQSYKGHLKNMLPIEYDVQRMIISDYNGDRKEEIVGISQINEIISIDPRRDHINVLSIGEPIIKITPCDVNNDQKDEMIARLATGVMLLGYTL